MVGTGYPGRGNAHLEELKTAVEDEKWKDEILDINLNAVWIHLKENDLRLFSLN